MYLALNRFCKDKPTKNYKAGRCHDKEEYISRRYCMLFCSHLLYVILAMTL